jgi:hypothetical protein
MNIHHTSRMKNEFYAKHDAWYWNRFYHHLGEHFKATGYENNKAAYYRVEDEFFEKFGCHRFVDYNSFRQGKLRRVRRGKNLVPKEEVKREEYKGPTLFD